jgi:hypothetical protein
MKPYKLIDKQKKIIKELTKELQYSKNKIRDAKRINTLIDVSNSFDSMLVYKYKTNALDTLILSLMYEILMINKSYENEIPLFDIVETIRTDLFYGSELKLRQVISVLEHHELKNKIANNSLFDKNFTNFEVLIKDLLNKFKQDAVWSCKD